jgi:hypothetical protein
MGRGGYQDRVGFRQPPRWATLSMRGAYSPA